MKKFLVFICLLMVQLIFSQDKPTPYKFTSLVDLYEFPTTNYTGGLDVDLPLYTINTRGFQLPLSLNYDQAGNSNVFYIGNQFGDAWVLSAAGTISRKCEYRPTPGFDTGTVTGSCAGTYTYEKFRNQSLQNDEYYYSQNPTATSRPESDLYSFSFLGLTGKFIIQKQGSQFIAKIQESSDFVTIQIGTTRDENNNFNNITITDKKGYKYLYTSPSNVNENRKTNITYAKNTIYVPAGCSLGGSPGEAAYFGPSIINEGGGASSTAGGGIISSSTAPGDSKFWENLELTEIYDKNNNLLVKYEYQDLYVMGGDISSSGINSLGIMMPRKKIYLKKINIINQGAVYFNNVIADNNGNVVASYTSSIEVKDLKEALIKKIEFGYQDYKSPSLAHLSKNYETEGGLYFHKRFLTSIKEFDTANQKNLTTSVEYKTHGITNASRIVDRMGFLAGSDYCANHYHKDTWKGDFVLQKIKYPTGGSVLYQFEPNTFSKSQLYNGSIKSENFDNQQFQPINATVDNFNARSFTFTANPGDTLAIINKVQDVSLGLFKGVGNFSQTNLIRSISRIGYTPHVYLDESSCKHLITKVVIPANAGTNTFTINYSQGIPTLNSFKIYKYSNNLVSNFLYVEGSRIKKVAYFNTNISKNVLELPNGDASAEKVITYTYEDDDQPNVSSGRITNYYRNAADMSKYNFFYKNVQSHIRGVGKQKTYYTAFPEIVSFREYVKYDVNKSLVYDSTNNLISENTQNNIYSYDGFFGETLGISKAFVKSNTQVSKNYENGSFIETNSETNYLNNRQVSNQSSTDALGKVTKTEFDYQTINNAIVNTQSHNYVNGNLKEQILNTYGSQGDLIKVEFKTPDMNAYEKIGNENTKYINGLLRGYMQPDGTPVTLVYGYLDTQIIAKIVNVDANVFYSGSYQSILNNLDMYSTQWHANYSEANLKTALNGLRTTFPNAMVTTYTYKPMVGISSITDENGKTATFEYDTFNRLAVVKDHIGNILNEYQYNFTN